MGLGSGLGLVFGLELGLGLVFGKQLSGSIQDRDRATVESVDFGGRDPVKIECVGCGNRDWAIVECVSSFNSRYNSSHNSSHNRVEDGLGNYPNQQFRLIMNLTKTSVGT